MSEALHDVAWRLMTTLNQSAHPREDIDLSDVRELAMAVHSAAVHRGVFLTAQSEQSAALVPAVGERWYILRPGAWACADVTISRIGAATVSFKEAAYGLPQETLPLVGLKFVERIEPAPQPAPESAAPALESRRELMLDPGRNGVRWSVAWGSRRGLADRIPCPVIDDDDFSHDARLYVSGDFGDEEEAMAYAQGIVDALNAAPETNDSDRVRAERDALRSALERLAYNYRLTLAGKPVRDVSETFAEVDAALKADGEAK